MTDRQAYTLRGAARAYGLARDTLAAAIRAGDLPASRLGSRRLVILRRDLDAWLVAHRVPVGDTAEHVVARILAREARRAGAAE